MIILDDGKNVGPQRFFKRSEIIIKKPAEHTEVIFDKMIDRTLIGAYFFGNQCKRGLRHRQQEGQVIVPQIFVKTVSRRQIQKAVDLVQHTGCQLLSVIVSPVKSPADVRELHQDALLSDLPVNDQF